MLPFPQPTKCDCHGDAIRLKDWSVSMVKHGMDAREKGMKVCWWGLKKGGG